MVAKLNIAGQVVDHVTDSEFNQLTCHSPLTQEETLVSSNS